MATDTRLEAFRDATAIVGIGYSRSPQAPGGFSRNSGEQVLTLATRAALQACEDAGLDPRFLDGGVMYGVNDSVQPYEVLTAVGARTINYDGKLDGGGYYPAFSIMQAAEAVHHGICDYVLVYRAMNGRSGVRMGQLGASSTGSNRVGGSGQFSTIYGLAGPPLSYAFTARRYMDKYGVTSEDFGRWAVNSRSNAVKNPRATMRQPITLEDHQNSRFIADPYHLLDCCLETDVGCAMVITTAEKARELRKPPVYISAAIGGPTRLSHLEESVDTGLRQIGSRVLAAAGIERKDIDIFMPYDNFTDCPMRMVEDMGWCERGEIGAYIKAGNVGLDGEIPVATQGGLISEGYAHGLNNALEAVQQLRGEAEDLCPNWASGEHTFDRDVCRQVREPRIAMHTGVEGTCAVILRRD